MAADADDLEAVRARIDAIDDELVRLVDARSALAREIAAAKARAAGPAGAGFGLRPAREAQTLRRLLARSEPVARPVLILRLWRELAAENLARQGPFHLSVWSGRRGARAVELARARFGAAAPLLEAARPEEALRSARSAGGVAVLALDPASAWWARLLAEPRLRIFSLLPCLLASGPPEALAVADLPIEPSGGDRTLFVTDAPGPAAGVEAALAEAGLVGDLLAEAQGARLYALAGFIQEDDDRLARAPGRLKGVVGAAPAPFDL